MTTFIIANETHHIIADVAEQDSNRETTGGAERFRSEADLANLAADWPMVRLIEIWNHLPGVNPVRRFKDRKSAVTRIWNALNKSAAEGSIQAEPESDEATGADTAQSGRPAIAEPEQQPMFATEGEQASDVAPESVPSPKKTTRRKKLPTVAPNANGSRAGSKTATVLELMKRDRGATLQELMSATGWQAHSVRGFISGTLGKKMALAIASTKAERGERTYSIHQ